MRSIGTHHHHHLWGSLGGVRRRTGAISQHILPQLVRARRSPSGCAARLSVRGSHAASHSCATHLSVTRAVTASAPRQPLTWHWEACFSCSTSGPRLGQLMATQRNTHDTHRYTCSNFPIHSSFTRGPICRHQILNETQPNTAMEHSKPTEHA